MAVITSRQPGLRPETIRTRLARFMPSRTATGWLVTWSAHNEHADEISDEHELQIAEHLGCYGSAVGHALAQAELTPQQLRLSADSSTSEDGSRVITIEVRAKITGPAFDQQLFDVIIRRAEPSCPVLRGLASEVSVRLIAILDDTLGDAQPEGTAGKPTSMPRQAGAASAAVQNSNGSGSHVANQSAKQPAKQGIAAAMHSAGAAGSGAKGGAVAAEGANKGVQEAGARGASAEQMPAAGMGPIGMMMGAVRAMGAMRGSSAGRSSRAMTMGRQGAGANTSMDGSVPIRIPSWLTARMAVLLVIAFGALAAVPVVWSSPA